jgi:subtilisin-like proprotein convertase family protein
MMDASAAVRAAKSWKNVGPEQQIMVDSGEIGVDIPDNPSTPAGWTLSVNGTGTFSVESVVVYLQLAHESRGDLEIVLTSPAGTMSVLHPPDRPENRHLKRKERWQLMTVRNFGEYPIGEWTLTLTDRRSGNLGDCIDLDYQYSVTREGEYTVVNCFTIEQTVACADGKVLNTQVDDAKDSSNNYRTGRSACCACGGGENASTVNVLSSWRLVIYGHGDFKDAFTESGSPRSHGCGAFTSVVVVVGWWASVVLS